MIGSSQVVAAASLWYPKGSSGHSGEYLACPAPLMGWLECRQGAGQGLKVGGEETIHSQEEIY